MVWCCSTGLIKMICTQYIIHWTLLQFSFTWYTSLLIKAAVFSMSCKLIKWTLILHICKKEKEKKRASSKFWSLFNSEWEKYKFQIQLNFPSDFVYLLHMNNTMTRQMVTIWVTKWWPYESQNGDHMSHKTHTLQNNFVQTFVYLKL